MASENNIPKEANFKFYLNTQGVRGRKGEKGDQGFSPTVTVSENTLNTYKLKVLTVDGEFETPNLRGSIITDGEGSFIRYNKATDTLYVGDIEQASPEIHGIVKLATEDDIENLSEEAVTTVSDVADFISTHIQKGDDSIDLSYDEDTGIITIKAKAYALPAATATTLGGIKVGNNLTIEADGTLSAEAGGVTDYELLENLPKLYGTEIKGDKQLSDYVKLVSPIAEVTGADYEKDIVIVGGQVTDDNLIFSDDWHPLFSSTTSRIEFGLQGAYTLNGNEFTPDNYASMPFALGDILGFPANTGADIAIGHQDETGQFIFTHLFRVDGLLSTNVNGITAFHVASKTRNGNTLDCVGTVNDSNTAVTGANFDNGMCYCQIVLNEQGNMEMRFLRNRTGFGTYGIKTISSNAQAIADTAKLSRLYFGGTDTRLNPLNQFAIYRQPNINLNDVKSEAAFEGLDNQINWAFPEDETSLRCMYDNNTVTVNDKGELCTTNNVAKKADLDVVRNKTNANEVAITGLSTIVTGHTTSIDSINTEINSLDDRVEALEDKPEYELPVASNTTLGGIKIGENLTITEDGTLNAQAGGGESYTLPPATVDTLGGVKIGSGVTVSKDGTISVEGGAGGTTNYEELTNLPSVNGVELKGNKDGSSLGLEASFSALQPISKSSTVMANSQTYGYNKDLSITGISTSSNLLNLGAGGTTQSISSTLAGGPNTDVANNKIAFRSFIDFPLDKTKIYYGLGGLSGNAILIGKKNADGTFTAHFVAVYPAASNNGYVPLKVDSVTYNNNIFTYRGTKINTTSYALTGGGNGVFFVRDNAATGLPELWFSIIGSNAYAIQSSDNELLNECDTVRFVLERITASSVSPKTKYLDYDTTRNLRQNLGCAELDFSDSFPTVADMANAKVVLPADAVTQRYLGLNIDNDTLKVDDAGQLYSTITGLPSDITTSITPSTVTMSSAKALNLGVPMLTLPENTVTPDDKLFLTQDNVVAGTNITIDQTATGITINASGGGGDISELEAKVEALETDKQDKLYDTKSVAIVDSSVELPADPYTLAGSATVDSDNHLRNTQGSSYLYINKVFEPLNRPWEIQAKFVPNSTGATGSSYCPLIAEYDTNKSVPQLYIQNGKIQCDVSTDGSTWNLENFLASNTETIAAGTVAYARLKYDGAGTYTCGFSRDGVTWFENSQNAGSPVFQSSASKFIIGADNRTFGQAAYQYIDLNETYIKVDGEYFWRPFPISESGVLGAEVKISETAGNVLKANDDGLYVSATSPDEYGIKGDYSTHYGILDCPNGLIDFNISNKQIVVNAGIVLKCAGNGTAKTTIASAINHTITSPAGAITLFYANGNILECGKVDYSVTEPEDNGVDNYQAWFNPDKTTNPDQQWQFKSNDTGNIWRPVTSATPLANVVVGNTGITSVSYIGYRVLDDDIIPQLSDIENLQDTVEALQTAVGTAQDDITALTARFDGLTLKKISQADYEELTIKDPNTLYVIIG